MRFVLLKVCFYFFVKQKDVLFWKLYRIELFKEKSCNFVKWALLRNYIKYLTIVILRAVFFFSKIMYHPCLYYTPGELDFLFAFVSSLMNQRPYKMERGGVSD